MYFGAAVKKWLSVARNKILHRIERAVDKEKYDTMFTTTSYVKFSPSSLDVSNCFSQISQFWRRLGETRAAEASALGTCRCHVPSFSVAGHHQLDCLSHSNHRGHGQCHATLRDTARNSLEHATAARRRRHVSFDARGKSSGERVTDDPSTCSSSCR
jgi:hypothetical protein